MDVDENEFYRQASLRICGSLEIEKAMHNCVRYVARYMPADDVTLYLTEHGLGALRLIARATADGGEKLNHIIPLPPEARVALKGTLLPDVRIVNDPELDPVARPGARFLGLLNSSFLIMFLVSEGKRLRTAAAVLRVDGKNRYEPEHLHLFALLNEPFVIALSNHLKHIELLKLKELLDDDNRYLNQELRRRNPDELVGGDFGLRQVMEKVRQVAPQRSAVLLLGETGGGKEVIADAIQRYSRRRNGPYIKVSCGAISPTLIDSELFGHEKGAFSGAVSRKRGRFERAHKGTIFLDEIGELTPEAQLRLLRVLQNREVERVGGTETIPVDIRVIAATHRNLAQMVETKQFRQDLWFRLNVFPIVIPPLRERVEDIPALIKYFIEKKSRELNLPPPPGLSPGAVDRLLHYPWRGNVRELENVVERALILSKGTPLRFKELDIALTPENPFHSQATPTAEIPTLEELNIQHIRRVLQLTQGKINGPNGCAAILGIKPNTLRARMDKLGISYGKKGMKAFIRAQP